MSKSITSAKIMKKRINNCIYFKYWFIWQWHRNRLRCFSAKSGRQKGVTSVHALVESSSSNVQTTSDWLDSRCRKHTRLRQCTVATNTHTLSCGVCVCVCALIQTAASSRWSTLRHHHSLSACFSSLDTHWMYCTVVFFISIMIFFPVQPWRLETHKISIVYSNAECFKRFVNEHNMHKPWHGPLAMRRQSMFSSRSTVRLKESKRRDNGHLLWFYRSTSASNLLHAIRLWITLSYQVQDTKEVL